MAGELTKLDRVIAKLAEARIPAEEITRGIRETREALPLITYEGAACLFATKRKIMSWEECMEL